MAQRPSGGAPGVRQLLRTAGNVLRFPAERVRRLFPTFSDEQVTAFIESLGEDVRGELSRRELEYRTLKKTLKVWAQARGPQALNPHSVEWRVSEEIKRCWRRETGSQLHIRVPRDSFYRVDIPAIKAGFDHVRELVLSNVTWGGDSTALFLENFTELNSLSITGAEMTELPAVIGDMKQLTSLKLNANGLQLTEHSAGLLSDLNALQVLDLSSNPLGVTPRLQWHAPFERELNLYWTRIERWPSGLREQAGLVGLRPASKPSATGTAGQPGAARGSIGNRGTDQQCHLARE